jgi:hypothetical protein
MRKPFVGGEGDFVVAVQASTVVDPAVGAFDHPPARLTPEPVVRFRAGDDGGADAGALGGISHGLAGVALVQPDVSDGGRDSFWPYAAELALRAHVGGGEDGRDQNAGAVDEDVVFDPVDFLGAAESARTSYRGCFDR